MVSGPTMSRHQILWNGSLEFERHNFFIATSLNMPEQLPRIFTHHVDAPRKEWKPPFFERVLIL